MTTGEVLRVRAAMKPIATVPAGAAHRRRRHRRGDRRPPPALRRLRGAGRRHRRRGDGRAGAGRRGAGEVRRRLGGRDPPQRRALPRHAAVPVTGRPARWSSWSARWAPARPRSAGCSADALGRRRSATPTPTSRRPRAARSPTSSSTPARRTSARWSATAVADALAEHDGVLALGGGAVLDPRTRDAAGRPPRGVPAGRARRRGEAGRPRRRPAAAARQRPRAGSRRCSTSAPRSTSRSPRSSSTPTAAPPRRSPTRSPALLEEPHDRDDATPCCTSAAPSPYDVVVGHDLADRLPGDAGRRRAAGGACSTRRRSPSWRSRSLDALVERRTTCSRSGCPTARRAKTAAVAADCWEALGEAGFTRSDAVVTFGGGATTDLGGFVAATWLRGVRVVHVPDHAARHGRRGRRRQDRHQHRAPARTWSAPSTSRPACCATSTLLRVAAARRAASPASARSSSAASSPTPRSSTWSRHRPAPRSTAGLRRCCASWSSARSGSRSTSWSATCARPAAPTGTPAARCSTTATPWRTRSSAPSDYAVRHGEAVAIGCVYVAELARGPGASTDDVVDRHRARVLARVGLPTTLRRRAASTTCTPR